MSELRKAIDKFLKEQHAVYQVSPNRLSRDAQSAKRAEKDHIDRWLFELLQNSDDAKAANVQIRITDEAIYVADNGEGFKPNAVEAISGTDFSDKIFGTIGRKGIGFMAVYTISRNPQIFSLNAEGLEFSQKKGEDWLREKELPIDMGTPYEWLPFWLSRDEAEKNDQVLAALRKFTTVIKLPLEDKRDFPDKLQPHDLLPFRHIRKINVQRDGGQDYILEVSPNNDGSWLLSDSREISLVTWHVSRKILEGNELPPREILSEIDEDERKHIQSDGISFLVATPFNNKEGIIPLNDFLPVYVFYPAEKDLAPVRALLHAEFLVKSDRTSLIPINSNRFNDWVANKLAVIFIDFVKSHYDPVAPSAYLRVLVPLEEIENHTVAQILWKKMANQAKKHLHLPDVSGNLSLSCTEVLLLNELPETCKARKILKGIPIGKKLLHSSIDTDIEATKALEALDCQQFKVEDVFKYIDTFATDKIDDHDWILSCWEWVGSWLKEKPHGEEHENRLKRVKELPLIPIDSNLFTANSLEQRIVTWRSEEVSSEIPDWLPLSFMDDWFRNELRRLSKDNPIYELIQEFEIKELNNKVVLKAFDKAIAHYWKNPDDLPNRFIDFLLDSKLFERLASNFETQECPILADIEKGKANQWAEARKTYFGREWGNKFIAELYQGVQGVEWAKVYKSEKQKNKEVLKWLGVVEYPRIVENNHDNQKEKERNRIKEILRRKNLRHKDIPKAKMLDRVKIEKLNTVQTTALLQILSINWYEYYYKNYMFSVSCEGPQGGYKQPESEILLWWEQVINQLCPSLENNYTKSEKLKNCWLPEKDARKAVGELLPIIDVEKFGKNEKEVVDWLNRIVGVRTKLNRISSTEWLKILKDQLPFIYSKEKIIEDKKNIDRVKNIYEAFLDSLDEDINDIFHDVPLLCRKGNVWNYVKDETRWLKDDNETAKAFQGDIWHISILVRLKEKAKKYLRLKPLSESSKRKVLPYSLSSDDDNLQSILKQAIPYVFVWICFNSKQKQDKDSLRNSLSNLNVKNVTNLTANIELNGVGSKEVERNWDFENHHILISSKEGSRESNLAQALAEFLKTKSDAEFYENFLRCNDDNERKKKLLFKDVPSEEIDRLLQEFHKESSEPPPPTDDESVKHEGSTESRSDKSAEEQSNIDPESKGTPKSEDMLNNMLSSLDIKQDKKENLFGNKKYSLSSPLNLKNPKIAKFNIITTPSQVVVRGGGQEISGNTREESQKKMSQEQKWEVEDCGRGFVKRKLEESGWIVEEMPRENPGFDLKAAKNGKELRVEVKAHLRKSKTILLTDRQYQEYCTCYNLTSTIWQLWNVENLDQEAGDVDITRYETITKEALQSREWSVNLCKCYPLID